MEKQDDVWGAIAQYRDQIDYVVKLGYLEPGEADLVAQDIAAVVQLAQRGVITVRLAEHLIDTMAQRKVDEFLERANAKTAAH